MHNTRSILFITPEGKLACKVLEEAELTDPLYQSSVIPKEVEGEFDSSILKGLLSLGAKHRQIEVKEVAQFWQNFSKTFIDELILQSEKQGFSEVAMEFGDEYLEKILNFAPPMLGEEYLSSLKLRELVKELFICLRSKIEDEHAHDFYAWLSTQNSSWNMLGKICFHLVENKKDPEYPFAFLATYSSRISDDGKILYKPLGKALQESIASNQKKALSRLIEPIQKAAEQSSFLNGLVESHEIFQAQAWDASQAYLFLKSIPCCEENGILVRVPNWWRNNKTSRPKVSVKVDKNSARFSAMDLLDFSLEYSLNGESLSQAELKKIMESTGGLILLKGEWVEIDKAKFAQVLEFWENVRGKFSDGISFAEGMRLTAGMLEKPSSSEESYEDWSEVILGKNLQEVFHNLREPENITKVATISGLQACLRKYQQTGVNWLYYLSALGLGACLADDMGLGKTIQILSLLLVKKLTPNHHSLLIVPASLIGNWQSELKKFAPSINYQVVHPSEIESFGAVRDTYFEDTDLIITTYSSLFRTEWFHKFTWDLLVIDEAQAIKNPGTKQSTAVKQIKAVAKIALTGTPLENRLIDLWSLFDFLNPGLLGSLSLFQKFLGQSKVPSGANIYKSIKALVSPYILRRLKTDKTIIADLPDKTEMQIWCSLSKTQAALYQDTVNELLKKLKEKQDGIERKGLILATLLRLKQICNHPSQWLNDNTWAYEESGKFLRLKEICEEIAAKQEKVLIFTQFREIIPPLEKFLAKVFKGSGLVLHGNVPVKERQKLVDSFQRPGGPAFFILSLKAGGTGLNLTEASHVVHFDRWWNPAVENQATDRAFRIGQKKNVLVHKFVCQGTVEEKIDTIINAKAALSEEILSQDGESVNLTALSDEELISLVSMDLNKAIEL